MSRRLEIGLLIAILVFAFGLRLFYFSQTPNLLSAENEGFSKIHLMLQWDQSPLPYPDTNFGPLHTILLWIPYKLTGQTVLPNRIMTLLFGMLMFWPLYRLVRRRFGPPEALASAALLAGLYPLSVASVVTLSEVPFVFFILLGLDLIDELTLRPTIRWSRLVGGALAINAACALRFEAWALLPIIGLYVLIRRGWKEGLIFNALLAMFPLVHMYFCWRIIGHPLSFLQVSAEVTAINTARKAPSFRAVMLLLSLGKTIGWPGLVLSVAGLVWSLRLRRLVLPALCALAMLAVLEYKSLQATIELDLLRYLALAVGLLALYVGVAAAALLRAVKLSAVPVLAATLILAAVSTGFSYAKASWEIRLLEPTQEVFEMLEKLKPELQPDDRILLGSEYHPVIVVESGLGYDHFRLPHYLDGVRVAPEEIQDIFRNWRPTVILADVNEPMFSQDLQLPDGGEKIIEDNVYRFRWKVRRWQCWRLIAGAP